MDANNPKITLHMVSSLDGFIAKKDNDLSWMEPSWDVYNEGVSGEDNAEFVKTIDCFIMGSNTYELALELGWVYGNTPVIVITSRKYLNTRNNVEFYSGDLRILTEKNLIKYENIWLVGGAMLCQEFLQLDLVDEICLTIIPILLGDGLSLFSNSGTEKMLHLKRIFAYKNGMIDLWYVMIKNKGKN